LGEVGLFQVASLGEEGAIELLILGRDSSRELWMNGDGFLRGEEGSLGEHSVIGGDVVFSSHCTTPSTHTPIREVEPLWSGGC
jgi:hypothetical protein